METAEAIAAFLTSRHARNLSPKTMEYYRWCFSYLDDQEPLPSNPLEIEIILAGATHRLSPQSLRDLWRGLRIIYRWLGARYQISNPIESLNPYGPPTLLVHPPAIPPTLPKVLSSKDVDRLLATGCVTIRDRALVLIVLDTGIRLSEISSLRKQWLDHHTLKVQGKRGVRTVPITQELTDLLASLGNADTPWIHERTGQPLTRAGIQWAYRRMFTRADLAARGPHILRHTFATEYLRAGGSLVHLQRILGHGDVKTTQIYLHLLTEDLIEEHHRVSPARAWL